MRLDPVAPDLDLVVGPAAVLEGAVGAPAPEVPGPVQHGTRAVREEGVGRLRDPVVVAVRHRGPAHVDLSDRSGQDLPPGVVPQDDPRARHRRADRWPRPAVRVHAVRGDDDGGLRRPVLVVQGASGVRGEEAAQGGRQVQCLARRVHLAQRRQFGSGLQEVPEWRARHEQPFHTVAPHRLRDRRRIVPHLVVDQYEFRARAQRREDLLHAHIERR